MTIDELLIELKRRKVMLRANGNGLQYRPVSAVSPELLAEMRRHKGVLLALLEIQRERKRDWNRPGESGNDAFEVPDGFTPTAWAKRLRYLASVCIHPGRAQELWEWAHGVEQQAYRDQNPR